MFSTIKNMFGHCRVARTPCAAGKRKVLNPGNELSLLISPFLQSQCVFFLFVFLGWIGGSEIRHVVNTSINIFILFYDIKYISNTTLMI